LSPTLSEVSSGIEIRRNIALYLCVKVNQCIGPTPRVEVRVRVSVGVRVIDTVRVDVRVGVKIRV